MGPLVRELSRGLMGQDTVRVLLLRGCPGKGPEEEEEEGGHRWGASHQGKASGSGNAPVDGADGMGPSQSVPFPSMDNVGTTPW